MITATELANALNSVLPYVVTRVINCGEEGCQEPNCWSCWGSEMAEAEATIAEAIFQASGKVLKAWKADQKCQCDAGDFRHREIPPICPEYFGDDEFCGVCWHDKECHQLKSEAAK
jgi:hypothetical protein